MKGFYRNLQQAPIKAEAWRQVQIALLRGLQGGVPVPLVIAQ
ncbi:MAG: hypothetical protein RMI89_00180 [Gloeomargarita sp. SKYBB_i_bin120]|nr:CHAT domain-containing protein [Gloeomargarita sp. SKYG98]MCS7291379.1 CHAT domain-containing protein [Gloeomargarita sp. SKYB120]MDW8176939.1 hypothetical protein [Gloeomargarita sp. SKYBB_i_bin120]